MEGQQILARLRFLLLPAMTVIGHSAYLQQIVRNLEAKQKHGRKSEHVRAEQLILRQKQ